MFPDGLHFSPYFSENSKWLHMSYSHVWSQALAIRLKRHCLSCWVVGWWAGCRRAGSGRVGWFPVKDVKFGNAKHSENQMHPTTQSAVAYYCILHRSPQYERAIMLVDLSSAFEFGLEFRLWPWKIALKHLATPGKEQWLGLRPEVARRFRSMSLGAGTATAPQLHMAAVGIEHHETQMKFIYVKYRKIS